jgi:hypothetical protein
MRTVQGLDNSCCDPAALTTADVAGPPSLPAVGIANDLDKGIRVQLIALEISWTRRPRLDGNSRREAAEPRNA